MARSLTEYTESVARLEQVKSGEMTEEEEQEKLDELMKKDRIPA
jgi:polyhydroxyalkanoate synthesis regulator phasin